ncbi:MAG: PASTA domain-containing protein [Bacteroidales bacterium]|nr:PASTA domain-containing protein [Bacteroidales bacterium]
MKALVKFIFSKYFFKNVGVAIGLAFVMLIAIALYLRIYTHHNKSFAVPDFTGFTVPEAAQIIESKKLRYFVFDSVYVADKKAGVIVDQHPKPGFLVKKNRKVFMTINASGPELVSMPALVGETFRDASSRLGAAGLLLGKLSYRYDITENVVLEQRLMGKEITKGTPIAKGSEVDLVLGKGLGNKTTKIPDLIGMSEEQARKKAGNHSFSIATVIYDPDLQSQKISDTLQPFVWRQRPISDDNVQVRLGSHIDIWVTLDSAKIIKETEEVPDSTLLFQEKETEGNTE